jgi:DNA-binding response OmpR family regulator
MSNFNPKNIKVLLIEDDPFLLNMYSTKFEIEGFQISVADNGEDGLKEIFNIKPDVILLDILMPKMNGFEVLEHIQKSESEEIKKIPIILLTNLNQDEDIKRGMQLGAVDYLIKAHFMPSEVVGKIEKALETRK